VNKRAVVAGAAVLLVVLALLTFARVLALQDATEKSLQDSLAREAGVVAAALSLPPDPPTEAELTALVGPDRRLVARLPDGTLLRSGAPSEDEVTATAMNGGIRVLAAAPASLAEDAARKSVANLFLVATVIGLTGLVLLVIVSRWVGAPYASLAGAAGALSRGRLDLRLDRSGGPEAAAIADALGSSAARLRESLRRERELALRASHELRTPLTSLRMDLEELADDDEVSSETTALVERCLQRVTAVDAAVDAMLAEVRSHPVARDVQVPLTDLAAAAASAWGGRLGAEGTGLSVELTGDPTVLVTPGPYEQLLEDLLTALAAVEPEAVRLVLKGAAEHVQLTVTIDAGTAAPHKGSAAPLARVAAVAEDLGGRTTGSWAAAHGLVVTVPRR
jgi:signal transduction histidine kinase